MLGAVLDSLHVSAYCGGFSAPRVVAELVCIQDGRVLWYMNNHVSIVHSKADLGKGMTFLDWNSTNGRGHFYSWKMFFLKLIRTFFFSFLKNKKKETT